MASFQAKIRGETLRKRENKNYRSVPFRSNLQRNKNYHCGFISSLNRLEQTEKEGKQKLLFRFVPTKREIENSKEIAKKLKKLKNTIMVSFQAKNRLEKEEKEEKQKLSFRFVPTRREIENSKETAKKLKKLKNTIMASFQAKNRLEREEKEIK